jgi:hypothetical protein
MEIAELIERLGGSTQVARECGVRQSAVSMWVARGAIPPRHQFNVWRLAVAAGADWRPRGATGAFVPVTPGDAA